MPKSLHILLLIALGILIFLTQASAERVDNFNQMEKSDWFDIKSNGLPNYGEYDDYFRDYEGGGSGPSIREWRLETDDPIEGEASGHLDNENFLKARVPPKHPHEIENPYRISYEFRMSAAECDGSGLSDRDGAGLNLISQDQEVMGSLMFTQDSQNIRWGDRSGGYSWDKGQKIGNWEQNKIYEVEIEVNSSDVNIQLGDISHTSQLTSQNEDLGLLIFSTMTGYANECINYFIDNVRLSEDLETDFCNFRGPQNECVMNETNQLQEQEYNVSSVFDSRSNAVFEAFNGPSTLSLENTTTISGLWKGQINIESEKARLEAGAKFRPEGERIVIGN